MATSNVIFSSGVDNQIQESIIARSPSFNRLAKHLARHKQVVLISSNRVDSQPTRSSSEISNRIVTPVRGTKDQLPTKPVATKHCTKSPSAKRKARFTVYIDSESSINLGRSETLKLKSILKLNFRPSIESLNRIGVIMMRDNHNNETTPIGVVWASRLESSTQDENWVVLSNSYYMLQGKYGQQIDSFVGKWLIRLLTNFNVIPRDLIGLQV
jgi:hypothetical protein